MSGFGVARTSSTWGAVVNQLFADSARALVVQTRGIFTTKKRSGFAAALFRSETILVSDLAPSYDRITR